MSPQYCVYFLARQVVAAPRDSRMLAKAERAGRPETAGRGWFDLPATQITDEVLIPSHP